MKSCPTCNRTYPDDTLAFCLMDGSVLSAPFDPSEGRRPATPDHSPPTEVLIAPTVAAEKPAAAQSTVRAEAPSVPTPFAESRPISASTVTSSPAWLLRGALILRGLFAIVLAVYALSSGAGLLLIPFGLYSISAGLASISSGLKSTIDYKTGWLLLVEGVFNLAVGICLYTDLNFYYWFHLYSEFLPPICLIFSGVCQTVAAWQLRRHISGGWSLMLAGGASVLFGFALAVVIRVLSGPRFVLHHYTEPLVGAYGLVAGVLLIVAGIAIRGKKARA